MPLPPEPAISVVPPELVDDVWQRLRGPIERGLTFACGDSTTPDRFRARIRAGEIEMWAIHDGDDVLAAVMLEIQQHDARRTLFIHEVAGRDMARWVDKLQTLLQDYRDMVGAQAIQTFSRDGMARRLLRRGWKRKATVMELAE